MPEPRVYSTEEWGAAPPHSHFATRIAQGIVVHNTENPNREPLAGPEEEHAAFAIARSIQQGHFGRGFSDTGQHFTISRGGLILEGRHGSLAAAKLGKVAEGAHAVSDGNVYNRRWYGIELEGNNLPEDRVTDQQFAALTELCAWLSFWGHFDSQQIKPHLAVLAGHTDCPREFKHRIPALIQAVHLRKVDVIADHG
jgi:hypothetical protein